MVSIVYQMNSGIAGQITRPTSYPTVESVFIDAASNTPQAFGLPVKVVGGKVQKIVSGDAAAKVYGFLVRPYPSSGNGTDGLGVAVPNTAFPAGVMKTGYMAVQVNNAAVNAPSKNSAVYVRVGNASSGKPIGGIEAAGETSVAGVAGTNTGNGTIGTLSATDATPAAVFTALFTAATKFDVLDAGGAKVGAGVTGTQLTLTNGLSLKITAGGTAFVAGDSFAITVTQNTVNLSLFANGTTYFTGGADANGVAEIAFQV
jgi:hypothetical protein